MRLSKYGIFFIFLISFTMNLSYSAASKRLIVPLQQLKGFTRVAIDLNFGPDSYGLIYSTVKVKDPAKPISPQLQRAAYQSLQELFANSKTVKLAGENEREKTLFVNVLVTARKAKTASEPEENVAAISVELISSDSNSTLKFPIHTYPFLLPEKEDEMAAEVKAGIQYLLGFLPHYIDCANQMDKNVSCDLSYSYGGR